MDHSETAHALHAAIARRKPQWKIKLPGSDDWQPIDLARHSALDKDGTDKGGTHESENVADERGD